MTEFTWPSQLQSGIEMKALYEQRIDEIYGDALRVITQEAQVRNVAPITHIECVFESDTEYILPDLLRLHMPNERELSAYISLIARWDIVHQTVKQVHLHANPQIAERLLAQRENQVECRRTPLDHLVELVAQYGSAIYANKKDRKLSFNAYASGKWDDYMGGVNFYEDSLVSLGSKKTHALPLLMKLSENNTFLASYVKRMGRVWERQIKSYEGSIA